MGHGHMAWKMHMGTMTHGLEHAHSNKVLETNREVAWWRQVPALPNPLLSSHVQGGPGRVRLQLACILVALIMLLLGEPQRYDRPLPVLQV